MAAIDHTCIIWKNGVYIPDPTNNLLPFEYGRDGNIYKVRDPFVTMVDISSDIKYYRDEYDAVYQRRGLNRLWRKPTIHACIARLDWLFRRMERKYYENEVGVWRQEDTAVYIYHDAPKQSYASFYKNDTDTYIILGGYGHHENVYCHFMNRGYGDEFEREMVSEAYRWLCTDILERICDAVTETWDEHDELLCKLQGWFGKDFTATQINTRKDRYFMRIIETCPECGHDLVNLVLATYPPIPKKKCFNCGWSWTGKQEEVVRVPFNENNKIFNSSPCEHCSNNPKNGGGGNCSCSLSSLQVIS